MPKATEFKASLSDLSPSFGEGVIDLRGLFYELLAEKWLILGITFVALMISSMYVLLVAVPQYQANVLLQIEGKKSSADLFAGGSLLSSQDREGSPSDVQTTLIKSPFILVPVVESLGLDVSVRPHYFPLIGAWLARNHTTLVNPLFGLHQYTWGGEKIEISDMHVSLNDEDEKFRLVAGKNQTYEIFSASGEKILHGSVGQLAQSKNNDVPTMTIMVKSLKANPGAEFFLSKLSTDYIANKIATRLQISDLGIINQVDKTGILQMSLKGPNPQSIVDLLNTIAQTAIQKDIDHKSSEAGKALKFLEGQLPLMSSSLNIAEAKLNQYRMKSGTIDLTVKSKMLLNQLADVQKELEKTELTRIMLLQQYTPIHPSILALKDRKSALQTELDSLETQLSNLPTTDQVVVGLMRDIKVKSQLYLILLNKIQELQVVRGSTVSDLRILNLAHLPNKALSTGWFLIILVGALFGFTAGLMFVILRKSLRPYVDDPNWLEQHFGIPTFAIIPYSGQQKLNMQAYKEQNRKEISLLAQTEPRDLSIEALRSLRTSLQFALIGAKNNIISIMGISPEIGKSFVAANFSHVLAEGGKRVVLIDGDIRKGYLQNYFSEKRAPGLSEAISGAVQLENVIRKTHHPKLDFISSGKFPPNPSELFMSSQFKELLSALSVQYDLVLLDTPPILAVTDSSIIGNLAGVNFLCVAGGVHQAEELELAMKRLQNNEVRVQGVIFNNIHARHNTQGRYNYYYEYSEAQ